MTLAIARIARVPWWRRVRAWLRPGIDRAAALENGETLAWADAIERHLAWARDQQKPCAWCRDGRSETIPPGYVCACPRDGYERPALTAMPGPGERYSG